MIFAYNYSKLSSIPGYGFRLMFNWFTFILEFDNGNFYSFGLVVKGGSLFFFDLKPPKDKGGNDVRHDSRKR